MNLVQRFYDQASRYNERSFIGYKAAGQWRTLSWSEVADYVSTLSAYLTTMGVKKGDRVLLLCENRPEWAIADLAIMSLGALVVPAYTTHSAEDLRHILKLTEPATAIVSNQSFLDKVLEANVSVDCVNNAITIDEGLHAKPDWHTALHAWPNNEPGCDRPDLSAVDEDDVCILIFTSGTSGKPKAAMLTHGNILHNVDTAKMILDTIPVNDQDRFLSFLPLAHAYEHTAGLHMPITQGAEIYYCESTDKLAQYLTEVSPSVCTAVPRLYDMLYAKIRAGVESSSGAKRWLFNKTVEIGTKRAGGQSLSVSEMLLDPLLTKLVRKKLLQRFGGRIKYFVSGGAALNPEVGSFFTALGVGIIQGYGQTEASPLITVNRPGDVVMDSVGSAFDGVTLRLTEEGELLVKGPNVMKGYWRDEASTAMTIRDGWLYTGDLATIDDRGIVRITGRKKDLIVTSGGDNISPSKIEGLLTLEKEVDQAVLIGDGKPWLAAILVPSEDLLNSIDDQKQVNATLNAVLKRVNESLNPAERVRKFILHNEPFTIDNGFVTPTQKIKRGLVIERFEEQINSLY